MTLEIDKDVLRRAREIIEADERSKPAPPMTDELRAAVEAARVAMIEGQARDYKRPALEHPIQDMKPGAQGNPEPAQRQGRRS
jgi:hypothetical protein